MGIIKRILASVMIAALSAGAAAFAEEEQAAPLFATIGEAMEADGYTGMAAGYAENYVVIVERDGKYIRVVAEMDEEGRQLNDAISEAGDIEAAFEAYDEHAKALPVIYTEEFTAAPKDRAELDALAGKTISDLEEAGYTVSASGTGSKEDEAVFTMACGLYEYDMILNEPFDVYEEHEENGTCGELTVKNAAFAGLSRNATELRFHADGTEDPEEDPWAEVSALMEKIAEALGSEDSLEAAVAKLTEAMPEQAEEIRMFAELFAAMNEAGDEDEFSFYTKDHPEAEAYYSTWVAENGDWRTEVYDEDGGLKLMIIHKLDGGKRDIWEYAAALNEESDALTAVPLGLHYREDTVTLGWDVTYYEDGDAVFTLSEDGKLLWKDLKEDAGKGLAFEKIGNFFGGRWMKGDTEVIFLDWHDGGYEIRLNRRGEDGEILKVGVLNGGYDPGTDTIAAAGGFEGEEPFSVTFSYGENRNVLWTENGESTTLEYSCYTD